MSARSVIDGLITGDSSDDSGLKSFSIRLPVKSAAALISLSESLKITPSGLLKLFAIDAIREGVKAYVDSTHDVGELGERYQDLMVDLISNNVEE